MPNPTDPAIYPIECVGYATDDNGDALYADDHLEVHLVRASSVKSTTRCPACQKKYSRMRSRERSREKGHQPNKRATLKRVQQRIERIENMKSDGLYDKLDDDQRATVDTELAKLQDQVAELSNA